MKEDYINARKLGEKARTRAFLTGRYPYLPALDEMIGGTSAASEIPLGVHEIPLHLIVGTKTSGRKNAFAYNFMPLLDPSSEFALKWASLYDYQKNEGLRDPIKVYEYMGRFYVEEGNKRVSVMNYFKSYSISADVIRIMPPRTDDLENVVYYEFLDFFKVTRFFEIQFSQKGSYQKLADQMGESLEKPWPEEKMEILRDGFRRFAEIYEQKGGRPEGITDGDAYLTYITVFPPESLVYDGKDLISKRITQIREEVKTQTRKAIDLVESPSAPKKPSVIAEAGAVVANVLTLGALSEGYSAANPLKAAFIYEKEPGNSSWAYAHELGRQALMDQFGGAVDTVFFTGCDSDEKVLAAIESARVDEDTLIFTTAPSMMPAALKAAYMHPKMKILNCSVNLSRKAVRTYYAKMYEAKFILGAIAASLCENHKIGYRSDYPLFGNIAQINAFALGASLVDPSCRVYLKWASLKEGDWEKELIDEGVRIISGSDMVRLDDPSRKYGLYRVKSGSAWEGIAAPVWDWGRYYGLICQSIMDGTWDAEDANSKDKAVNYWYGLKSGVVDVLPSDRVPYETRRLASILKQGIITGAYVPFEGQILAQKALVRRDGDAPLTPEEIITMDWLLSNIEGEMPRFDQLREDVARNVSVNGILEKGTAK